MKKFAAITAGLLLAGISIFALSENSASASVKKPVGVYQCAVCGVIVRVNDSSTVLDEIDFYDGHAHDWRYIGEPSGTIHPIR